MILKLVTRPKTHFIRVRLRAFGHLRDDQEQLLCQTAMEYTEGNLHEEACKIWISLLQKHPRRYQFQNGFLDAARPLVAGRRLELLARAFPEDNLDYEWVKCQKAITYTENGLHDEACKTWITLLQKDAERLAFQEGFLNAIRPLSSDQRSKLLQLVKNDKTVLWVDHAIAMEYYSRKEYDNAYQAFSFLFKSQRIEMLKDAKIPLLHSLARGDRSLVKERLQQLPYTLKSVDFGSASTAQECCDSLLDLGYIKEAAELWIQYAKNDNGLYLGSFLSRLCQSLHLQHETQDCFSIWKALVQASPRNSLILAEFRVACAAQLDDIAVLHILEQLVVRYPESTALFSMLVQHLKPADANRRLAVWRGLAAEFPQNRHFRNELCVAHNLACVGISNYDTLCMICMERDMDTCFFSCGHVSCKQCAASMKACHICRSSIKQRVKVYAVLSM